MNQVIKHPGVDSGIDLIRSGVADTLGIHEGTDQDHTGHKKLFAMKDGVAVAYWKPDYWQEDGYEQAGWYYVGTHRLLLRDDFWGKEGAE